MTSLCAIKWVLSPSPGNNQHCDYYDDYDDYNDDNDDDYDEDDDKPLCYQVGAPSLRR